jgi:alkanesulfonate monooxygenase SsuD/methylene tetrahydromethanopterin reductase-like flavin-dependent oxidoreductase (luciferase family)
LKFGIFLEHPQPRPWGPDDEHQVLKNALEQVEVADRLGIDCVWVVEHHFLEEYSHSSAPEVFLAAASQRTGRIRLGHGIIQLPPVTNHPARVAERIATLDLVSDGRVEFGTGESSSDAELGAFGIEWSDKREQWNGALDAITRMFVEEPFAGYDGRFFKFPPRNVVPKPRQRPHPPLWVACTRMETIHLAASKGIGALSFNFVDPGTAGAWADDYYATLASDECVPAGFAVNANIAIATPFMCHADEQTAVDRGLEGCDFFRYSGSHYYISGQHYPGVTNLTDEFDAKYSEFNPNRQVYLPSAALVGGNAAETGFESHRGAIGTPSQIRSMMRGYADAGIDQVMFVSQAGRNRHEHICESMELFAKEVMGEFHEEEAVRQAAKAERLGPAIDAALRRRQPVRPVPDYSFGAVNQA